MTPLPQDERETIVADLVGRALEHRDETGGVEVAVICCEYPELVDDVRRALDVASKMPAMQTAGLGADPAIGGLLAGRYRLDKRLGAGAMGVVYGATDLDLGRYVAIKVLHLGLLDADEAAVRFEREATALAAIEHEAVVTIYDRGVTEDGSPYLVIEHIDGVSLAHVLDEARALEGLGDDTQWLTQRLGIGGIAESSFLRQVVRWSASLAGGIEAAHRAGVYHRDVKPSNVMIGRDGRAVLLDFGIAAQEDHATLTRSGAAIGTPAYMAPEALSGRTKAQPSQDIYGLTATLYHLLTLKAPYQGSPSEVLTALATREPVPAFKVRPGLPRDAQAILDKGLARKASDRYSTAASMEADLRAFLAYRPVSARPIPSWVRGWRRMCRSRAFLGAAAALAVVAGLAGFAAYGEAASAGSAEAFRTAWPHVPANFGIVEAPFRMIRDADMRAELEAALDAIVDAGHEVVAPRTVRAAFYLDHGQPAKAARDMQVVARHVATPFASDLARRYAALPAGAVGVDLLELGGLPDPTGANDQYLFAFHAMRFGAFGAAGEALQHDGLEEIRHAAELRLSFSAIALNRLEGEERFLEAGRVFEEIVREEGRFGSRSAMTAHWAAYALSSQERFAESLVVADEGLALAPSSNVTRTNAAHDAFRLGRLERAREYSEEQIAHHPTYLKAHLKLMDIALELDDFEGARALVEAAPFSPSTAGGDERLSFLGHLETTRALDLMASGAGEEVQLAAQAARTSFESMSRLSDDDEWYLRACKRLEADDAIGIYLLFIERQIDEPLRHHRLRNLNRFIPDSLDSDSTEAMRSLLDHFADALAHRALIGTQPR